MQINSKVAALLLLSSLSLTVAAQSGVRKRKGELSTDTLKLQQVVVFGKGASQQLKEGAYNVNAIDIKSVASSITNVSDLINRSAGVKIRTEGGMGSDFDLSLNGMSGNSVKYFIDGVPLNTLGGNVTLQNIPVNTVERIEIYKGVVPAYLGSDALGGAVNIITRKHAHRNFIDASVSAGSFGSYIGEVNAKYVMPKTDIVLHPSVSDNTLIYVFQNKSVTKSFFVAFIDAATMKVKNVVEEKRAALPAGTAYGELLQNKLFMDEHENLYIAANTPFTNDKAKSTTSQYGRFVRVNAGENKIDESYLGYNKPSCEEETAPSLDYSSKIITCDYLGNNKALLYLHDPVFTGAASTNKEYAGWGNTGKYNSYYAILDLTTDVVTEVTCNGKPLPYSYGTFSQRSFVLNNKAYIGTNPKDGAPTVYIYSIASGKTTKGAAIREGYDFDRIVYVAGK